MELVGGERPLVKVAILTGAGRRRPSCAVVLGEDGIDPHVPTHGRMVGRA